MFREITDPTPENEQSPEEIKGVLTEAIEKKKYVLITQKLQEGGEIENVATPVSIEGWILMVDVDGFGLPVELRSIRKAEIID